MKVINHKNFDEELGKLLKKRCAKGGMTSRNDMEGLKFEYRSEFASRFVYSLTKGEKCSYVYKISHWGDNAIMQNFLTDLGFKINHQLGSITYKKRVAPGIIFLETKKSILKILPTILKWHYNHEMAIDLSLNMQLHLCINMETSRIVFEFYDDRGFHMYYFTDAAK